MAPEGHAKKALLFVDGKDITRMARAVVFRASVDEVNRVEIELFFPGLDVSMPARVSLSVVALPGFSLVEEPLPGGGKRWHTERR